MQKVNFQYQCNVCKKTHFSASDSEECCTGVNSALVTAAEIRVFGIDLDTFWNWKEEDENFQVFIDKGVPKLWDISHVSEVNPKVLEMVESEGNVLTLSNYLQRINDSLVDTESAYFYSYYI